MSNRTFPTFCNQCGKLINMVEMFGVWKAYEFGNGGPHFCQNSNNAGWSIWKLGHKFTCTMDCWWCGKRVFFHTNGNGDAVLLEKLGSPWVVHPCWEKHKKEQDRMIKNLESDLKKAGYDGKKKKFNLVKSKASDVTIKFKSNDVRILDRYLEKFCKCLVRQNISFRGPHLYPAKQKGDIRTYRRIIKIPSFENLMNLECFRMDVPGNIEMSIE
ncbi:uS10 family ribosomal protein [Hydrogenimonas cancrithermarum]|nr:hypothetical protein [Hydrogenimonas cancrithermarum]